MIGMPYPIQAGRLAYLAGPIDDVTEIEARSWRSALTALLREVGVGVFNPAGAHSFPVEHQDTCAAVDIINRFALLRCRYVIVNLEGNGRCIGTIRELEFAQAHNIETIVILKSEFTRAALAGLEVVEGIDAAALCIKMREAEKWPIR